MTGAQVSRLKTLSDEWGDPDSLSPSRPRLKLQNGSTRSRRSEDYCNTGNPPMSRAFVKEAENETAELPDRPISPHRNFVTAAGLAAIEAALGTMRGFRPRNGRCPRTAD